MEFPACPVFEKNVEKVYRSLERAPKTPWRLATIIQRWDHRWVAASGALLASATAALVGYSPIDPLSSWGWAIVFLLVVGFSGVAGVFLATVGQFLAWHFSEANTASPYRLNGVLEKVAGDARLEAVVQRWIDQRKAYCVLEADVERLAKATSRLEELRELEQRRLEGLRAVDSQLNCVSRYHAYARQDTLSALLPAPEETKPAPSRL